MVDALRSTKVTLAYLISSALAQATFECVPSHQLALSLQSWLRESQSCRVIVGRPNSSITSVDTLLDVRVWDRNGIECRVVYSRFSRIESEHPTLVVVDVVFIGG